ncbi:unnamed protein product (mitochondrion) [Plasmodiophora brassicae]|uniref:Uncharacterized protein n=1 Tax=Plasmodiophora brassicae TaxID=37360 RepID=A0A0G4J1M1_PLABS|nr:hypothetical protein PBRA_002082 [Plasmodiophora brassicae]SPQ93244.1 unnamed protein product [Plasmodiophora brassicae]
MGTDLSKWAVELAAGATFGYAMNKGHVHVPAIIMDQFRLRRFIMMKMFLGALSASMIAFAMLSKFRPAAFATVRARCQPYSIATLISGGALLGAGMAIGGTCPGTVYVQLGAGIPNAIPGVLGGLLGAATFIAVRPLIKRVVARYPTIRNAELNAGSSTVQFALGTVCLCASLVLEVLVPSRQETAMLTAASWTPTAAGLAIGALQLPLATMVPTALGTSSSFVIAVCRALNGLRASRAVQTFIASAEAEQTCGDCSTSTDPSKIGQAAFVSAAVVGSFLASAGTTATPFHEPLPSWASSFAGGFLVVFGARLAGGCTSGHGLSGTSMLNLTSWIAVLSMFASGIAVGLLT